MTRLLVCVLLVTGMVVGAVPLDAAQPSRQEGAETGPWDQMKLSIAAHLGRPYVWGAVGSKSFDCSGFVWRVMFENGILMKRTTARKLYLSLPAVSKTNQWSFGTIVFFDNLKHCGIVNGPTNFYHAQLTRGTNLSDFFPYWRPKISGFRAIVKRPGKADGK